MYDIGIVAVAVNVKDEIILRFSDGFDDSVDISSEISAGLNIMADSKYMEDGLLNKSRALNDGVRDVLKLCKVIVCTDIDMLIPPSLIDYTIANVKSMNDLWVVCRDIAEKDISPRRWEEWLKLPCRLSGFGSWNAMLAEDWIRSGGWDERLTGWGGEDDVFKKRRTERGIHTIVCEKFPLMHVNHESRQNKKSISKGNRKALAIGMTERDRNWLS